MFNSSPLKVLVIEDNHDIASNIADYFAQQEVITDFAYDGELGCTLALEQYFDCIVLDIALPGMDGLTVCKQLRDKADRHIPIIMLTARDTLDDKLVGFAQGADDYLTKPFALDELYVRCLALSKRHVLNKSRVIELGQNEKKLCLDIQTNTISRADQTISLQPIAFKILKLLMESHPRALSKSELIDKIWGDEPTDSDALRSHIYQLRKEIDKPFSSPVIKTIHSVGLALDL
ncbi:response regulator transcription factor [Pseudoalteromonas sp. T1lg65]|uniref:response regulator transcription factor n=1 Tax=Pseudoalteromonas sp. T1lg65 TaxID=2077101 RepID=UPI003F7A3F13